MGCTNRKSAESSPADGRASISTIVAQFPAEKLDEIANFISQDELAKVAEEGESENWIRQVYDPANEEIVIRHKQFKDNSVRFIAYRTSIPVDMLGVNQINAQISATEIWEYHENVDGDRPERWNQYLLPEYKLEHFFDERVELPEAYANVSATPFIDYNISQKWITISLNKWAFMRDVEMNKLELEGALDTRLIKYRYMLNWNGDSFVPEQVMDSGYGAELLFTANVLEREPGGPDVREFACTHGVTVTASSSLKSQAGSSYRAANVLDTLETSAWSEAAEGDGVGEWVEFTITENFRIGDEWQIANGYNKNRTAWEQNNRIKKFNVTVNDKVVGVVVLANIASWQLFNIAPSWLKTETEIKKGSRIRFTILEVYKGSKYSDTLITSFFPTGNCG